MSNIPNGAVIWEVLVNSVPTKPVRGSGTLSGGGGGGGGGSDVHGGGNRSSILIPLLVGSSGVNDGSAQTTSVELAFLSEHNALGDNGTIDLSPPTLDIPATSLSVEIQMPSSYAVNFTGGLTRLKHGKAFSFRQPVVVNYNTGNTMTPDGHQFGFRKRGGQRRGGESGESGRGEHDGMGGLSGKGGRAAAVGAGTTTLKSGKAYRFEKLLVVGDGARLKAHYRVRPNNKATTHPGGWMSGWLGGWLDRWNGEFWRR